MLQKKEKKAETLSGFLPETCQTRNPHPSLCATLADKNALIVNLKIIAFDKLGHIGNIVASPIGIAEETIGQGKGIHGFFPDLPQLIVSGNPIEHQDI
jgi:hypothetical protein